MLFPKIINLCDKNLHLASVKSRNDFIEKAIIHYVGYLHKDDNSNYLNQKIDETLNFKLDLLEEQFSTVLFKLSVEINILINILAATTEIDTETLRKIRNKSIQDVKKTVGKVDLEAIFKSYSMKEGA